MKKELSLFITCFFLYSTIIVFLYVQDRESLSEVTKNDKEKEITVKENEEEKIIKESNSRLSDQMVMNITLFLGVGILLFIWENDKNIDFLPPCDGGDNFENRIKILKNAFCGDEDSHGAGLCEKQNWFCLATFVSFIAITFLVEFVLNRLLIGSLIHLFSKDKDKRYFHTLEILWKKREQLFSSFSKTKNFSIVLSYLLYTSVIVMVAKLTKKCFNEGEGIIKGHQSNYCCCYFSSVPKKVDKEIKEIEQLTPKIEEIELSLCKQ